MPDHALHLAAEPAATARGGDRALEFDLFFERERARLFQALCLVTRNRFEAEELAQDAFLAVYERWDRVREMEDPTGYLYRTAMNAFRSWHRRSALAAKRAIGLTRADDSIEQLEEQDVVVRALASIGDGFMLAFPSARRALHRAGAIERAVAERFNDPASLIRVRIGVHVGEAAHEQDDFFGHAVSYAADREPGDGRRGRRLRPRPRPPRADRGVRVRGTARGRAQGHLGRAPDLPRTVRRQRLISRRSAGRGRTHGTAVPSSDGATRR